MAANELNISDATTDKDIIRFYDDAYKEMSRNLTIQERNEIGIEKQKAIAEGIAERNSKKKQSSNELKAAVTEMNPFIKQVQPIEPSPADIRQVGIDGTSGDIKQVPSVPQPSGIDYGKRVNDAIGTAGYKAMAGAIETTNPVLSRLVESLTGNSLSEIAKKGVAEVSQVTKGLVNAEVTRRVKNGELSPEMAAKLNNALDGVLGEGQKQQVQNNVANKVDPARLVGGVAPQALSAGRATGGYGRGTASPTMPVINDPYAKAISGRTEALEDRLGDKWGLMEEQKVLQDRLSGIAEDRSTVREIELADKEAFNKKFIEDQQALQEQQFKAREEARNEVNERIKDAQYLYMDSDVRRATSQKIEAAQMIIDDKYSSPEEKLEAQDRLAEAKKNLDAGKDVSKGKKVTSVLKRIAMAIAAAMTQYGIAISGKGGSNPVLGMIDDMVDREAEDLKTLKREKGKEVYEAKLGEKNLKGEQKEDLQRFLAKKAMMYKNIEDRVAQMMQQTNSPEIKARGEALRIGIQEKQNEVVAQLEDQLYNNKLKGIQSSQSAKAAAQQAYMNQQRLAMQNSGEAPKKEKKRINSAAAKTIAELDSANKHLDQLWNAYEKKVGGWGVSNITSKISGTEASDYVDTAKVITQMIGGILEGGKLTDADYQRYVRMMPMPGDLKSTAKNKLDSLRRLLNDKRSSLIKGYEEGANLDTGALRNTEADQVALRNQAVGFKKR